MTDAPQFVLDSSVALGWMFQDERDPYSGTVCGEDAKFIVWGGRGIREGSAVAYPACKEHARKWGSARRIGEDGSLISFDED